ncbi:MAG: FAD/NAD(P)-binding protein [Arthrobacter sp.]|nr:FAD/NAD(P)-binding protein [Arthrobacter sp.]
MVNPAPTQQPLGGRESGVSTQGSPTGRQSISLVLIGAGPRALMLLERLLAHRDPATHLRVDLVDPYPFGAGRIWRAGQSPLLRLNSTARDVTIFADADATLGRPATTGPSLAEWVAAVRGGELSTVSPLDIELERELFTLAPDDFPSRRLHQAYLEWATRRLLDALPAAVTVTTHEDTVVRVESPGEGGGERVHLASGSVLAADGVVYLVGHTETQPTRAEAGLATAARAAGLTYHRPAYTADEDYSDLLPGEDVIVRGLGLAAVDLVVLLAQGRGGRFVPVAGHELLPASKATLRYVPSGREPRLLLGSRRGVPYRSKSLQSLDHALAAPEVFTAERLAAAAAAGEVWDFDQDAWPLIATELHLAHYRELFHAHPERTRGTWERTREVILSSAWDSPALRGHLLQAAPEDIDRFHVSEWDRPLERLAVATRGELDSLLTEHIRTDLLQHRHQAHSASLAVFHAVLGVHVALAGAPSSLWNRRSREVSLPTTWQSYASYLTSGPPPERLEQLLALVEAGVVGFLGPELKVELSPDGRSFRAHSPAVAQSTTARALVDAWLPRTDPEASSNPALADLAATAALAGRRIDVDPATAQVRAASGGVLPRRWALGAATSTPDAGAFSRPGVNALPFRTTDAAAASILAGLAALRPAPSGQAPAASLAPTSLPTALETA